MVHEKFHIFILVYDFHFILYVFPYYKHYNTMAEKELIHVDKVAVPYHVIKIYGDGMCLFSYLLHRIALLLTQMGANTVAPCVLLAMFKDMSEE